MAEPVDVPTLLAMYEGTEALLPREANFFKRALAETWAQLQEARESAERVAVVERAGIVSDLRHLAGGYEMAGSKTQARTARDLANRYESAGTLALGEMLHQEILKRDAIIHAHAIESDHCEDDVVRAIVERQASSILSAAKERDAARAESARWVARVKEVERRADDAALVLKGAPVKFEAT